MLGGPRTKKIVEYQFVKTGQGWQVLELVEKKWFYEGLYHKISIEILIRFIAKIRGLSMENLIEKDFKLKSIFFSYGHDDNQEIVERLKVDLEKRGHKVWLDISKIKTWDDWRGRIAQGIHDSNMAIAFISFHSVREPSVCRNEISMALHHFG